MIEAVKKLAEAGGALWNDTHVRKGMGLFLSGVLILLFKRYRNRFGIRPEKTAQPPEFVFLKYSRKQAFIAILGVISTMWYLFEPKVDRALACFAAAISLYVLLDTNVLGSARQASAHAEEAHTSSSKASDAANGAAQAATEAGQLADGAKRSVEIALQKLDALKHATGELDRKVKELLGVEPLPDLKRVLKKLEDTIKTAEPVQGGATAKQTQQMTFLLASVPAVGARGAPTEGGHFGTELEAASTRLKGNLQVICYDSQGRKEFYQEERKLEEQTIVDALKKKNDQFVEFLRHNCGESNIMETRRVRRIHLPSSQGQPAKVVKVLPPLDCLHFLIVNWAKSDQAQPQAVLWHLDYPEDGGDVNGAGFWTSNPKIIATFIGVFEQRAKDLHGTTS